MKYITKIYKKFHFSKITKKFLRKFMKMFVPQVFELILKKIVLSNKYVDKFCKICRK